MKPRIKYDRIKSEFRCTYCCGGPCWIGFGSTAKEAYINFCQINQFRLCDIGDTYHLAA